MGGRGGVEDFSQRSCTQVLWRTVDGPASVPWEAAGTFALLTDPLWFSATADRTKAVWEVLTTQPGPSVVFSIRSPQPWRRPPATTGDDGFTVAADLSRIAGGYTLYVYARSAMSGRETEVSCLVAVGSRSS